MDRLKEIFEILNRHKLRSSLTSFGVFWGILLLVLLTGASKGLENGTTSQFSGDRNAIYIWRQNVTQIPYAGYPAGRWVGMDDKDIEAIKREVRNAKNVLDVNQVGDWDHPQYVTFLQRANYYTVQGAHPQTAAMNSFIATQGRFINAADIEGHRKVVVIGERVYRQLFSEGTNAIKEIIVVAGLPFEVVGVFKPKALGLAAEKDAELVLIPNSTLRHTFNQEDYVNQLRITPTEGADGTEVEKEVVEVLKKRWGISPSDAGVYGSYNTQSDFEKYRSLYDGISTFSLVISIGTMLAGMIGVSNIMLISVKERTREIGLRKAIGANSFSIILLISQEAFFLTLVPGCIGLLVGVGILSVLGSIGTSALGESVFSNPHIDLFIGLVAVGVLIFTALLSAIIPAHNAARVDPIVSLQSE